MAIINLKNISFNDSDNIKLDKVNYNFDQLVANGGGPQGAVGVDGQTGPQGVTGYQGPQGVIGDQGFQGSDGAAGAAVWGYQGDNINQNLSASSIFPIHDPVTDGTQNPPVVNVGFKSNSQFYGASQQDINGRTPYQFIINRNNTYALSNLAFRTNDTQTLFTQKLSYNSPKTIMELGFTEQTDTVLKFSATNFRYVDTSSQADIFTINSNGSVMNVDTVVDADLIINGNLLVSTDIVPGDPGSPDVDKIAVSADTNGTIIFKNSDELGGTAPIGTIISILPSIYNNSNNFLKTETVSPGGTAVEIRVGSGIGDYEGWYLCNGQTWTNGGTTSHNVPDLNSFSYTIDSDGSYSPNSQGSVSEINNELVIIGGADISMDADFITPNYSINSSINTSDTLAFSAASGTEFKIKRLPQIIYLGEEDLYWQDGGNTLAPSVNTTYDFIIGSVGNSQTGGTQSFTIADNQGVNAQHLIQLEAPSGYVWSTAMPASAFTDLNGGTQPNISQGPPPAIDGTDNTKLNIYISQTADGNNYDFYYSYPSQYITLDLVDQEYTINNTTSFGGVNPITQTLLQKQLGSTQQLAEITLTAPLNKYFDTTTAPTIPFAYYGSGIARTNDLSVSSYQFVAGNGTVSQPHQLKLIIEDSDYGNTSANSTGITGPTYINITAKTYENAPRVTSGEYSWSSFNYNQWSSTETSTITNNTADTVLIKPMMSNNKTGDSLPSEMYMSVTQGSTQYSASATTTSSGATTVKGISNNYYTLAAGSSVTFTWTSINSLSSPQDTSWEANLAYKTGSTSSDPNDWTVIYN